MKYKYNNEWRDIGIKVSDTVPISTIVISIDGEAPAGWLRCDGSLVRKADYPELYEAIKDLDTEYVDDEYFNLPIFPNDDTVLYLNTHGATNAVYIIKASQSITQGTVSSLDDTLPIGSIIDWNDDEEIPDGFEQVPSISYEEGEVLTDKVWIDGKPIYRKVIVGELSQYLVVAGSIDTMISANGAVDLVIPGETISHRTFVNQTFKTPEDERTSVKTSVNIWLLGGENAVLHYMLENASGNVENVVATTNGIILEYTKKEG